MREVDLIGFGTSKFFTTYSIGRFTKWLGISQADLASWLAPVCFDDEALQSFGTPNQIFFEACRFEAFDERNPYKRIFRWHIFRTSKSSNPRSGENTYLGNMHAIWKPDEHDLYDLERIEFSFLPAYRVELQTSLAQHFLRLKLRS